jgi:hypothetical protein
MKPDDCWVSRETVGREKRDLTTSDGVLLHRGRIGLSGSIEVGIHAVPAIPFCTQPMTLAPTGTFENVRVMEAWQACH